MGAFPESAAVCPEGWRLDDWLIHQTRPASAADCTVSVTVLVALAATFAAFAAAALLEALVSRYVVRADTSRLDVHLVYVAFLVLCLFNCSFIIARPLQTVDDVTFGWLIRFGVTTTVMLALTLVVLMASATFETAYQSLRVIWKKDDMERHQRWLTRWMRGAYLWLGVIAAALVALMLLTSNLVPASEPETRNRSLQAAYATIIAAAVPLGGLIIYMGHTISRATWRQLVFVTTKFKRTSMAREVDWAVVRTNNMDLVLCYGRLRAASGALVLLLTGVTAEFLAAVVLGLRTSIAYALLAEVTTLFPVIIVCMHRPVFFRVVSDQLKRATSTASLQGALNTGTSSGPLTPAESVELVSPHTDEAV